MVILRMSSPWHYFGCDNFQLTLWLTKGPPQRELEIPAPPGRHGPPFCLAVCSHT